MQDLVNAFGEGMRDVRSGYHLTLRKAIETLETLPPDQPVMFDWNNAYPREAMSYRGYYSDLAFTWSEEVRTVSGLLAICLKSLGRTYYGYKGGDYFMDDKTPLWAAAHGSTGRAIIGMTSDAVLTTKELEGRNDFRLHAATERLTARGPGIHRARPSSGRLPDSRHPE